MKLSHAADLMLHTAARTSGTIKAPRIKGAPNRSEAEELERNGLVYASPSGTLFHLTEAGWRYVREGSRL